MLHRLIRLVVMSCMFGLVVPVNCLAGSDPAGEPIAVSVDPGLRSAVGDPRLDAYIHKYNILLERRPGMYTDFIDFLDVVYQKRLKSGQRMVAGGAVFVTVGVGMLPVGITIMKKAVDEAEAVDGNSIDGYSTSDDAMALSTVLVSLGGVALAGGVAMLVVGLLQRAKYTALAERLEPFLSSRSAPRLSLSALGIAPLPGGAAGTIGFNF